MPRSPIIPSTPDAALDDAHVTYRRRHFGPDPAAPVVNMVETTLPIPALGTQELPATPTKYIKFKDSAGTTLIIPAYAAS